jgi:hypothetical protein
MTDEAREEEEKNLHQKLVFRKKTFFPALEHIF